MKDMVGIWESLIKPPEFANSKAEDFFDFSFTALPHKVLAEDQFYKEIDVLRDRFVDPKNPEFVLGETYKKDIPADGFAPFAERIWATVKENKDLDIPSQKEMLAMFRCDEISAEAFRKFAATTAAYKQALEKGELVEAFGKKAAEAYNTALAEYDVPSSRYQPDVAAKKREALATKMNDELFILFQKQLQRITERSVSLFEKLLQENLPRDGSAAPEFGKVKDLVVSTTTDFFYSNAKESIREGSEWTYELEEKQLKQQIEKQMAQVRVQQLGKLMEEMKKFFMSVVLKPLDKIFETIPPDMWARIRETYTAGKESILEKFKQRLQGFDVTKEEEEKKIAELNDVAFQGLKDKMADKAKYLNYIMNKKFDEKFKLDERKLPRRWKPTDDIAHVFMEARDQAEALLEMFCFLRLSDDLDSVKFLDPESTHSVEDNLVVISENDAQAIKDKFHKETETTYLQALRDQENVNSASHIPMYVIVLIMILGFNEFITVISNPLLLILVVMLGVGGYVIYILGMGGPFKRAIEAVLHTSLSGFQQWLSNQVNPHNVPLQGNQREETKKDK